MCIIAIVGQSELSIFRYPDQWQLLIPHCCQFHPEVSLPEQREPGGAEDDDDSRGDQHRQPQGVLRLLQVRSFMSLQ